MHPPRFTLRRTPAPRRNLACRVGRHLGRQLRHRLGHHAHRHPRLRPRPGFEDTPVHIQDPARSPPSR
eukprot:scaffold6737_cov67-Phaeocystis_antarctica.AAC.1